MALVLNPWDQWKTFWEILLQDLPAQTDCHVLKTSAREHIYSVSFDWSSLQEVGVSVTAALIMLKRFYIKVELSGRAYCNIFLCV